MSCKSSILYSERLILLPLGLNHHSKTYVNWMNNSQVNKYLESGGDYTLEKLFDYLKLVEISNIHFWGIHLKSSNKHIGNIKIDPINKKNRYAEFGMLIGDTEEWGKGYAKEASICVINYCFSEALGLRKINLGVSSNNIAAIQLYKKIGFVEEGRFRNHIENSNGYSDILRMAIFNPKYD
jgi:ribosomal-protein-alanine N-acetyltransferase